MYKLGETFLDFCLTTDHPASKYGIPVVVDKNGVAYGPADNIPPNPNAEDVFSAFFKEPLKFDWLVFNWANKVDVNENGEVTGMPRTAEEVIAASRFLAQWPEGQQIDPEYIFSKWQWRKNHDD